MYEKLNSITIPNDFIQDKIAFEQNDIVFATYSTKTTNENILVRALMHCMVIVLQGDKIVSLENQTIKANENSIIFLSQNNYFMSEIIPNSDKYKSIIICFNDKFIHNFITKYKINTTTKIYNQNLVIDYKDNNLYKLNIKLLQNYIQLKNESILKIKLEEIFLLSLYNKKFISFLNHIKTTSPNRIKHILEANMDEIYTLNDMCYLTKLSNNQLRAYFKKTYKQNPKQWLNHKRLQKAMFLVKTTNKPITTIAIECKYATVSWFIYCFKKEYSKTPKQIRQNL